MSSPASPFTYANVVRRGSVSAISQAATALTSPAREYEQGQSSVKDLEPPPVPEQKPPTSLGPGAPAGEKHTEDCTTSVMDMDSARPCSTHSIHSSKDACQDGSARTGDG